MFLSIMGVGLEWQLSFTGWCRFSTTFIVRFLIGQSRVIKRSVQLLYRSNCRKSVFYGKFIYYTLISYNRIQLSLYYRLPYNLDTGYKFTLTYAILLVDVFFIVMSINALDCLYYSVSTHVSAHFQLLNIKIEELTDKLLSIKTNKLSVGRTISSDIFECIERHNFCIQLLNEVEDVFNVFMFIQFLSSSINICIVLLSVLMVSVWM